MQSKWVQYFLENCWHLEIVPPYAIHIYYALSFKKQPADYEPSFFRGCTDEDTLNPCMKNPLKLEVGNVNSKYFVLALKSVLDPCEDENDDNQDDVMSLGADSAGRDGSSSDSEKSRMFRIKVIWLMKTILKILQKMKKIWSN